ncbi:hypothetical protein [Nonomuraea basaltis]|uniref:hypothetical protein n=1 Tax=Nonomuraea basaltis TaxID=2495887 RepID=UPI00110C3F1F|nr:hypothetical protein [Nonomuraea basaltis]TMS00109.1 hypothetical protein EJK15_03295 [Nonomuraea basaltis]
MIAEKRRDESDQERIRSILATIKERLDIARRAATAQLRDETFTKQRFADMAADLEFSHDMIQHLQDTIYALLTDPPPTAVVNAMRSTAGQWHPVRWRIGGRMRSFLVPSVGRADPIAESQWWRRFTEQYGGECS